MGSGPPSRWHTFSCILIWWKGLGSSGISLVKSLIPFMKVPLHGLLQRPHLLTPLYWVFGFQYTNFERAQTFTIAPAFFFFCISLIFYILVLNKWCFLTDRIFPSLPSLLTPLPPPIKAASCFELSLSLEDCHKVKKSNQKCLPVFGLKNPKVPWGNIISESNSFPWVTKGPYFLAAISDLNSIFF